MTYERRRWQDKWRIERMARAVREQMGLDQFERLDPWELADRVPAHVFYPEDLVETEQARHVSQVNWDGFGFCFDDDPTLIVLLNSARPVTRQTSTLMEELSHQLLGHRPSRLLTDPTTGLLRREFNEGQEHEAYDLGTTLLLPKELVQRDVGVGNSAISIARGRGCSRQVVEYRIRRCRLWNRYTATGAS